MPAATLRMYPARTRSRWLSTSASDGSCRSVRRKSRDIRIGPQRLPRRMRPPRRRPGQDGGVGIHEAAAQGFGAAADLYERARPGYDDAAVARLAAELRLSPAALLLELGAGTGKLTRQLQDTGAGIVAVEPVAAMRSVFVSLLPGVPVVGAAAEALPLVDGRFHAVVAGQAFHWFHPDLSLREMHRVLRPRGRLGLIWNVRDESVAWVAALSRLLDAYVGDVPS